MLAYTKFYAILATDALFRRRLFLLSVTLYGKEILVVSIILIKYGHKMMNKTNNSWANLVELG